MLGKVHGRPLAETRHWLVVRDGHAISKRRFHRVCFEDAHGRRRRPQPPRLHPPGVCGDATALGVTLPSVALTPLAKSWAPVEGERGGVQRQSSPIPLAPEVEVLGFMDYLLQYVCTASAESTQMSLRRLLSLIECSDTGAELWHIGFLIACYQRGIFAELFRCAILSPSYTWTAKIVQAAVHLLKHSLVQCGRRRLDEAKAIISCIEMEDLKPCQARVAKEKRTAGVLKSQTDAARLERLPPVDTMKEAVKKAMLTLKRISADHRGMSEISRANKTLARACVVACIFLNGFAGRSGEWSRLRRDTVEAMLANGDTYIRCKNCKREG